MRLQRGSSIVLLEMLKATSDPAANYSAKETFHVLKVTEAARYCMQFQPVLQCNCVVKYIY